MSGRRRVRGAFSLVELLVVIAIVSLILGIALPVLGHVRQAGVRSACAANLRMLGVALGAYRVEFMGFPAAAAVPYPQRTGRPLWVPLAPYLDAPPPRADAMGEFASQPPWRCPADSGLFRAIGTSYGYDLVLLVIAYEVDSVPSPWRSASQRAESPPDIPILSDASGLPCEVAGVPGKWHAMTAQGRRQSLFGDGRVETIR